MTEPRSLAELTAELAAQHAPRTPERRAAAALHVALVTTKTAEAARRALGTVRDIETRESARTLLDQLEGLAEPDIPRPGQHAANSGQIRC